MIKNETPRSLLTLLFQLLVYFSWSAVCSAVPNDSPDSRAFPHYGSYYTINNNTESSALPPDRIISPLELLTQGFRQIIPHDTVIDLFHWTKHEGDPEDPAEPYNRKNHFGTWVNDPTDSSCYDTRTKVLIRDSETPVTFRENNRCAVESGTWNDPYTGSIQTLSSEIQIDHVVPLKQAYLSGAAHWSQLQRCVYANFIGNNFHLLAVDANENMKKGDKAPDGYLPPNKNYICSYLETWLRIKLIWNLTLNPVEAKATAETFEQYGCSRDQGTMSETELRKQRAETIHLQEICRKTTANH